MEKLRKIINRYEIYDKLIWFLTVMLIPIYGLFDGHSMMQIMVFTVTGLTLCVILLKERLSFRPRAQAFHICSLLFVGICYITGIWGWNVECSHDVSGYLLRIVVCTAIYYHYYEKSDLLDSLFQAIKWGGYILAYISLIGFDLRNVLQILIRGGRLFNGFMCYTSEGALPGLFNGVLHSNINILGMPVAFSVVLGIYDIIYNKRINLHEIMAIVPAMLFIIASAGKKNYLIVFFGIIFILLLKLRQNTIKRTLVAWGILIVATCLALYLMSFLPMFEEIFYRFDLMLDGLLGKSADSNLSTDTRMNMITIGFAQFKRKPLFGIGIDNSWILLSEKIGRDTYLHCNYIELLVDIGIIGTMFFYLSYIYPVAIYIKYRKWADSYTPICIIMIVLYLFVDVACVTYSLRVTYLYWTLFFIHANHLKRQAKCGLRG